MTSATTPAETTGSDRVVVEFTRGTARFVRLFGVLALIAGIGMVLAGGVVWGMVSSELAAEKIVVSEDSALLPGAAVAGRSPPTRRPRSSAVTPSSPAAG